MRINKHGCAPDGDVCMAHCRPLECRHGCFEANPHPCSEGGWTSLKHARTTGQRIVSRGNGPDPRRFVHR